MLSHGLLLLQYYNSTNTGAKYEYYCSSIVYNTNGATIAHSLLIADSERGYCSFRAGLGPSHAFAQRARTVCALLIVVNIRE